MSFHINAVGLKAFRETAVELNIPESVLSPILDRKEKRIEVYEIKKMIDMMIAHSGERNVPLHIGRLQNLDYLQHFGSALKYAKNFDEILSIIEHYYRYIHTGIKPKIVRGEKHLILELCFLDPGVQEIRYPAEAYLSSMVTILGQVFEGVSLVSAVEFYHHRQSPADLFHTLFGKNVAFGQPANRLYLNRKLLESQLVSNDLLKSKLYNHQLYREHLDIDNVLTDKLTEYLITHMAVGDISLKAAAASLHIAPRTLQYRLRQKDTGFRELLSQIRFSKAVLLLKEGVSTDMTAFLVGFSNTPAFYKGYKGYFGMTPGQHLQSCTVHHIE